MTNLNIDTGIIAALCSNCAGGDGIEACRRDGGCSCGCHLGSAQIELCEFETEPFTDAERGYLAQYNCRVLGIPDCFDVHCLDTIPGEFTVPDVTSMFRSYYGLLTEWRAALFDLTGDLKDDAGALSVAARRYLQMEAGDYIGARDAHRTLVIEYFLGHNEHGDKFDYISEADETLADWRDSLSQHP